MYRVAFLGSTSPSEYASQMEAFRTELRGLGYVEGKNVVIEFRWAQARNDRLPELAEELVRLKPDVLVTHGAPGALAAKRATSTIPIVVGVVAEAVAIGAVDGLARPGGNITGSSFFVPELSAKRLQFLKEAVPNLGRVGLLLKRDNPVNPPVLRAMEQAAQSLKIQLESVEVTRPADIENAVSALVKGHAGAIAVIDEAMLLAQSERIANMAKKHSLPTIGSSNTHEPVVFWASVSISLTSGAGRRFSWTRSSAGPSRAISPSSSPPSSSWSSTSEPRERSASRSRPRCWRGRIR